MAHFVNFILLNGVDESSNCWSNNSGNSCYIRRCNGEIIIHKKPLLPDGGTWHKTFTRNRKRSYNADGVIDLSTSELVTKNYQYFLDMLDEFLGGLDGTPTFIGGNNKLISKLRACARRASMYQVTKDNWGNQVESYGGIPFVDLKTKPGTNDEVVPIESLDGKTSLYVARLAMDGLHAVSFAGVAPVQTWLPDFSTAGAVKKGEVEMNAAIALKTSKAAGVFRGIKVK